MSLAQIDLERLLVPNAEFLFFTPKCHPKSKTDCVYVRKRAVVVVACATCKKVVAELAIAVRTPELETMAMAKIPTVKVPGKGLQRYIDHVRELAANHKPAEVIQDVLRRRKKDED